MEVASNYYCRCFGGGFTLKEQECFSLKDLAVKGEDLINIGYKPGRALGAVLRGLLDCVIAEEVENNKLELLRLADKWLPR